MKRYKLQRSKKACVGIKMPSTPPSLPAAVTRTFCKSSANKLWDLADGLERITLQDVGIAIPEARRELDAGFFRVRLDRVSDSERKYLRSMASLGPGPYISGDVAKAMQRSTSQVANTRESLIRRGLCFSRRYGEIEFTVPMFDEYLRRTGM